MAKRPKMTGQPKDAIALLKADHQKVRQLFAEYDAAGDRATRRSVATLVFVELETHAQLEEHVFYPAVNEETEDGPELVTDSLEEHQTMKQLIQELRAIGGHAGIRRQVSRAETTRRTPCGRRRIGDVSPGGGRAGGRFEGPER